MTMAQPSGRVWQRLRTLVICLGAAAFVFLMPARLTAPARTLFNEAVGPVETAAFQATGDALAATGTLTDMFLQRDRERALAAEVARLGNEVLVLADAVARARRELDAVGTLTVVDLPFHAVSARISAYDTSPMRQTVSVRAGARDGVGPGMAAVAQGALVGVVTEAGPRQCRVRLITDPGSALPCRAATGQDVFVLQGTGAPLCNVDWVDRHGFLGVGDVLVTSARRHDPDSLLVLPDGVPVATVQTLAPDRLRPLFLEVAAEPRARLERLETVQILVPDA